MKKTIFIAISIFCVFISISASVKMIGSSNELKILTINCHTDYSIIIEFPKKVTIGNVVINEMSKSLWSVDHDLNLMWAQPEQIDSPDCIVIVETGKYDQIKLRLRVEKDPKRLIHTIVLKESVFSKKHIQEESGKKVIPIMKENMNMQSENEEDDSKVKVVDFKGQENSLSNLSSINEKSGAEKEIRSNELEIKKKKSLFDFDTFFSLTGGTQSFADSSFAMGGEIIVAAKNESGLFFQGAGKTLISNMIKQYGFSVGAGFEPGKLGFFLFGDVLMHKFGEEFNSTTHLQIRPSVRYRLSDKVHLAGFFALPIGAWQYSGVEVIGNPGFGYYNKSLFHAGLDLSVYLKKMFVDLRALIAEGSAFGIDLKAGYKLIKKIFVTLNYSYATTGDYTYMEGITNSSRIGVGVTYSMRNFENRAKNRIIFRPDYPMVVVAEKELDGENASKVNPEISLTGTPLTGYAPLDVSFKASHKGFQGDVEMTWFFNTTYFSTSSNKDSAFTYTLPGTYECYVEGRDQFNNFAKSNVVSITVLDVATGDDEFTIISSVINGTGTIDPEGSIVVKFDEDQKYTMTPADGWHVLKVLCDGKSVGAVTEYTFNKCEKDHTISVEFTETPPLTYVVSASSGSGGSISPDGDITVTAGDSIEFTLTPDDGYELDKLLVDGSQVTVNGNTYNLENIQKDQSVEAIWKLKIYTVTGTVRNNQYGTIDPVSTIVEHGSDAVFTFTPEDGNKQTIRYWINGQVSNNEGSTGITISNVTSNQNVEVEFDWIYYDVTVRLFLDDSKTSGSIDPGPGTYTEKKGTDLTFNFYPDGPISIMQKVVVNSQNKGAIDKLKIYDLGQDEYIDVYMQRKDIEIAAIVDAGGCAVTINSSIGQSGTGTYTVKWGDDITFTFNPTNGGKDYYIGIEDEGVWSAGPLMTSYTFHDVVGNKDYSFRIKCVDKGDPPPF